MIHTLSQAFPGEAGRRSVRAMATETTRRSLAFDLLETDLGDHASLSRLVIDHTIAPVRALVELPAPRPDEGRSFMFEDREFEGEMLPHLREMDLPKTAASFDTVSRALLLFGWLFPNSAQLSEDARSVLDAPGTAVLDDYWHLTDRSQEAIEDLVSGILGEPTHRLPWYGTRPHRPARNEPAMAELAAARELVSRAISPIPDEPDTILIDIGLQRMDWWTARDIDKALHEQVHRRLIWFGTMEPLPDADGELTPAGGILTLDRGVFAAQVPDTLTGLVLLDLSEQFGRDRKAARCGKCDRLLHVNPRQAGRARKGQAVYHLDCLDEHRLDYFRAKSRERYARTKGGQP